MILKELKNLIKNRHLALIKAKLLEIQEPDIAELLDELDVKPALLVFRLLPKELAADVFVHLDGDRQAEFSTLISDTELAEIIDELYFDDMIDFIEEVPANVVKRILINTTVTERKLINQFLNYPDDSAGSLMTIEFVDLKKEVTVAASMKRIKRIGLNKETIYTCYVISKKRKLEGIVSLKDLVLSDSGRLISDIMETEFISVHTNDDQEYIADVFKKYDLLSLPVVDNENRLVGIITIDDIVDVIEVETTEDFQRMAAIDPTEEEYLNINTFNLAKRRITWLIILMFSAVLTEFVTTSNMHLIQTFGILSAITPMLMSTGGNTGAQSATLVIRGLTLGNIKFKDLFKVIWKEIRVGVLLGVMLGMLNFTRIIITYKEVRLATVVGLTLICTTTFAALMGGLLPIIAKKLKLDPAIMASPMITTIVDATTLLIFFYITSLILF